MSRPLMILAFALAACGSKAVDLDEAVLVGSSDPTVIGTVRQQIGQIAVDEERLYWTGASRRQGSYDLGSWALRGCLKRDCAPSVVTYAAPASEGGLGFGVHGGEIYWFESQDNGASALVASSVAGGPTRVVSQVNLLYAAVFDADSVYTLTSDTIEAIQLSGNAESPRVVVEGLTDLGVTSAFAAQGDYVYWIEGGVVGTSSPSTPAVLQRARKDGVGGNEVLINGLEAVRQEERTYGSWFPNPEIALDSTYVYWTKDLLFGSIQRCPVAGCAAAVETVAAPIRSPSGLLIDGETLYFPFETDAYRYALGRCSLGKCAAPDIFAQGLDETPSLAVDDQYLYFATTDQDLQPNSANEAPSAQIRRLSK